MNALSRHSAWNIGLVALTVALALASACGIVFSPPPMPSPPADHAVVATGPQPAASGS